MEKTITKETQVIFCGPYCYEWIDVKTYKSNECPQKMYLEDYGTVCCLFKEEISDSSRYQAANFLYCGYHISSFYELDGETYHKLLLTAVKRGGKRGVYLRENFARAKEVRLKQFRYIYFIKKHWLKRLRKPLLPYPKHYLNQVECRLKR